VKYVLGEEGREDAEEEREGRKDRTGVFSSRLKEQASA